MTLKMVTQTMTDITVDKVRAEIQRRLTYINSMSYGFLDEESGVFVDGQQSELESLLDWLDENEKKYKMGQGERLDPCSKTIKHIIS